MSNNVKHVSELAMREVFREASAMSVRLVATMQAALMRDVQRPNITFAALMLKISASDFSREFVQALEAKISFPEKSQPSVFGGLGFELVSEDAADSPQKIMQISSALFSQLQTEAKTLGIHGMDVFDKTTFLTVIKEAMVNARIDEGNLAVLMPYACAALDSELVVLYRRIKALF